jgi:hypothetical protein
MLIRRVNGGQAGTYVLLLELLFCLDVVIDDVGHLSVALLQCRGGRVELLDQADVLRKEAREESARSSEKTLGKTRRTHPLASIPLSSQQTDQLPHPETLELLIALVLELPSRAQTCSSSSPSTRLGADGPGYRGGS